LRRLRVVVVGDVIKLAGLLEEIKSFIESQERRKCVRVLKDIKHLAQEALEADNPEVVKSYLKAILKELERYGVVEQS
jgi:DNA-binding HxlR family transcriptional regulator